MKNEREALRLIEGYLKECEKVCLKECGGMVECECEMMKPETEVEIIDTEPQEQFEPYERQTEDYSTSRVLDEENPCEQV